MAKLTFQNLPEDCLPQHIGIIMDGNRRWATNRGLPTSVGHKKGADVFQKISRYCHKIGIRHLTLYVFSTENWKRPQAEVDVIMNLLRDYLNEGFSDLEQKSWKGVRVRFLGDRSMLAADICEKMQEIEQHSSNNDIKMTINLAINYGGRGELAGAVRALAQECVSGTCTPAEINEQMISDRLYTVGQPDPDLIIRPGGESRISNFLLWQSAYSELLFMEVLWPDFTPKHLEAAILEYAGRSRRFGGI